MDGGNAETAGSKFGYFIFQRDAKLIQSGMAIGCLALRQKSFIASVGTQDAVRVFDRAEIPPELIELGRPRQNGRDERHMRIEDAYGRLKRHKV